MLPRRGLKLINEVPRRNQTMKLASKIAIAGVLVSAATAPALADEWRYLGGPTGYVYADDGYGWSGGYAYGGPYAAYGDPYAYSAAPYYGRWYGPRYRYAPATSDYNHRSRQLQGTR